MEYEKAIKRHYCGNGEGMFEDSKGAWVLYEDVKHLIELTNQHNQQSEVERQFKENLTEGMTNEQLLPSEQIDEMIFGEPETKTIEERAKELYPTDDDMFINRFAKAENAMQLARQEAYIKGATDNQNK